ncbi:hypothetical protein GCM10009665_18890 [Kitasatospora nipponensis]|uniref:Uncharacterized protein n=1 Tax=Kitasatospora nipponensis TaxID=258049 RepID=A0ABN1W0F5_9ACTN
MSTVQPVRASFGVLRQNRRLLVFPLVTAAALALTTAGVAVPLYLLHGSGPSPSASEAVAMGVSYLALGFVVTCCNAAMICAVHDVLRGEPVRFGASCRRAMRYWRALLIWSLLSTTVLLLVRQLERLPVVGPVLRELFSAGWELATYLALPAMMVDGLGVLEATRRSARLVRETFTRQVFGSLWIALPLVVSVIAGFIAFMIGVESDDARGALAGGLVALLLLMSAVLVGTTVSGIFRTMLYRDSSSAASRQPAH